MKMTQLPYHIPEYTRRALKLFDDQVDDEDIDFILENTYGVSTLFIDDQPEMLACIFEVEGQLMFTGGATWRGPKFYSIALHYADRLLSQVKYRDVFAVTEQNNLPVLLTLGKLGFMIYAVDNEDVFLVKQSAKSSGDKNGQRRQND